MSAALYQPVYLIITTIFTLILSIKYGSKSVSSQGGNHKSHGGFIIAIILSFFIGFRPLSGRYFVDMANYSSDYYILRYGKLFDFSWNKENYLFDNLFDWLAANYFEITIFFLIIAIIYFIGYYIAIAKLFPNDSLYSFIIFLGAFSTFSYATNGIKAGAAAALFLCAIAYNDKKWIAILCLFATLGIHHSMIVPIVAYIAALFCKKPKYYFCFWVFCLLMSAAHVTYFQELFSGISNDESAVNYLTNDDTDWGGKTGFRLDFILYSALPIVVGWYAIFRQKVKSIQYNFMLNIYLFTNAIWMLCMYVPFNNRIAYLSWCIYPIILVYPFFNCHQMQHQKSMMNGIVWIQLLFTLFMYFV